MLQTLRQSARLLLQTPGPTVAAVVSLALALGANTTVFTLIDAIVLRPIPVSRSDELVAVSDARYLSVSLPAYRDLAEGTRTLSGLAAFATRAASLNLGDASVVGDVQVVSANYFEVLGINATRGRLLNRSDDTPGREPSVVLSSAFWRQSLGSDPSVIGRSVEINGSPFTVVGVAPPRFRGVSLGANPAGWIAIGTWPRIATGRYVGLNLDSRGWGWLRMVGRLRPGVQPEQVRAELNAFAPTALRDSGPDQPEVSVIPLRAAATGIRGRADLTRFIGLLTAVVFAVLGIACANVSGLLLARALSRRRELAVRIALGCTRARLARAVLADAVVLGTIGAACGLLVAMWTIDLLHRVQLPGGIDMSQVDVVIRPEILGATFALALLATLVFGFLPALQGSRGDVAGALKDRPLAGGPSRQWLRGSLVTLQVTLSFVLLVGTALFTRTLQTTLASDLGFDPRHVAYATTNVSLQRYDSARAAAFYQEVLARIRGDRNVASAAWTRLIPSGDRDEETVSVPGYNPPSGRRPTVSVNVVTSGYFEAMGIPILRGRSFTDADAQSRVPVAIVSDAAAKRFWNGDALGRHFTINNTDVTVVGIAHDVPAEPGDTPGPFVYGHALQQVGGSLGMLHLVVRANGRPAAVVPTMTAAIRAAGPAVPILEARTMREQLLDLLGAQRTAASLLWLLSAIALVLSAAGIYAMVSFWVNQRTREFGVRMALGATASTIRRLALKHVAAAIVTGIALGVPLAWTLGRAARGLLFQVSSHDPLSFALPLLVLLAVAVIAGLIPAQRAARTDPLKALRAGTE